MVRAGGIREGGTRQEILRAAQGLFGRFGYAGTSIKDIADSLGITKAAVSYHFPSKEALFAELTTPVLDIFDELLDRGEAWRPTPTALLESYWTLMCEHRPLVDILVQSMSMSEHPVLMDRVVDLHIRLVRLLVGEEATLELRARAVSALGALLAPLVGMRTLEPVSFEASFEAALAALGTPRAKARTRSRPRSR